MLVGTEMFMQYAGVGVVASVATNCVSVKKAIRNHHISLVEYAFLRLLTKSCRRAMGRTPSIALVAVSLVGLKPASGSRSST